MTVHLLKPRTVHRSNRKTVPTEPTHVLCLQLIADGTSVIEAANLLGSTPFEVEDFLFQACDHLKAVNVTHAVTIGLRSGMIK